MDGVREETAEFRRDDPFAGVARFRRFGHAGPAYEVLGTSGANARIRLLETGEVADLPLGQVSSDPLA